MINLILTEEEAELMIVALEVVHQLDGLGFSEVERNLAVDLMETVQESTDELNL